MRGDWEFAKETAIGTKWYFIRVSGLSKGNSLGNTKHISPWTPLSHTDPILSVHQPPFVEVWRVITSFEYLIKTFNIKAKLRLLFNYYFLLTFHQPPATPQPPLRVHLFPHLIRWLFSFVCFLNLFTVIQPYATNTLFCLSNGHSGDITGTAIQHLSSPTSQKRRTAREIRQIWYLQNFVVSV